MEFISFIVVGDRESVRSFISLGVLIVEARGGVERLVQVSYIVDQKAKGIGSSSIVVSRVESVLNIVIHVRLLVAFSILA